MTFAPGKKQNDPWAEISNRDLQKDLHRIKNHYEINTLVSLI